MTSNTVSVKARTSYFALLDGGALLHSRRVCDVELAVALVDPARPFVPGNRGPDMVRSSPFARGGDFLLRLARCQGKDLIVEARRGGLAARGFCHRSALAPA
jgi:hypothetical protein